MNGELVIEAGQTERHYWRDLWRYRELFFFLAWRDVLVRYKQTAIGIGWSVIRPLLAMVAMTVVFRNIAKVPIDPGIPHPLFTLAAILPWQLFSTSLTECSNSLIGNTNLISKVYFPRLIVPTSAVIVCVVDLVISATLFVIFMVCYQYPPTWRMITLPLFVMMAFGLSVGAGLWLAAWNVKYRDFRYIVPFIVQFGFFFCPIGFGTSHMSETLRVLYSFNPMVGVIEGFRWALLGDRVNVYMPGIQISILVTILLLTTGISYFRKVEKTFADVI